MCFLEWRLRLNRVVKVSPQEGCLQRYTPVPLSLKSRSMSESSSEHELLPSSERGDSAGDISTESGEAGRELERREKEEDVEERTVAGTGRQVVEGEEEAEERAASTLAASWLRSAEGFSSEKAEFEESVLWLLLLELKEKVLTHLEAGRTGTGIMTLKMGSIGEEAGTARLCMGGGGGGWK